MARLTILDVLKRQANDGVIPLVDEATLAIPEVRIIPTGTIANTAYNTLVRTSLPEVKFRSLNEGIDVSKAGYINRRVETHNLNPRFECDELVALEHPQGVPGVLAEEGMAQTAAAFQHVAKQLWLGLANDAKGFPGLPDIVHSSQVMDIAGATAGQRTSVWGIKFGPTNCRFVLGHNGRFRLDDPRRETLRDSDNKPFTGWVQEMVGNIGFQAASIFSVGRIKGLTKDSTKGLDDDVIGSFLANHWRAGMWPDALFCSMQSLEQLRASRTATNPTGAPAPFPESAFGIPIYVTEAIPVGETV